MGESPLINTYIINEIFTKNDIRFIDIEQRVDTNLDGSIISYENPEYIMFMDLLEKEEKRLRSEKIKQGRKFKEKIKK